MHNTLELIILTSILNTRVIPSLSQRVWVLFFLPFQLLFAQSPFSWSSLPNLPVAAGQEEQKGLAGMFAGVHNQALILAGGANFPDSLPWEGGSKKWWRDIYVLVGSESGEYEWVSGGLLPVPLAYGQTFSTVKGVVCVGGNNADWVSHKVWRLQWSPMDRAIKQDTLPDLPQGIAHMSGAQIGNVLYILGGENKEGPGKFFYALDLEKLSEGWVALPAWPGSQRAFAMSAAQHNGKGDRIYLIGGRYARPDSVSALVHELWAYEPVSKQWERLPPLSDGQGVPISLSAGAALASGAHQVLVLGGADGRLLNQFEQLALDIASEKYAEDSLLHLRDSLYLHHPGFRREIWAFNTVTQQWAVVDTLPEFPPVTTPAVLWGEQIILPSGEISPGIRSPRIWQGKKQIPHTFGRVNYAVLILYLIVLVGLGVRFAQRQATTEDFFKGGKRIPWWAAGLSIFATQLSAITFMGVPAKTYATDWTYFFLIITILMIAPFVIRYFLPFYRRLGLTTAYEYLELRFNLATRLLGSLLYLTFQFGRLAIVLLLPSLALSIVTGISVELAIVLMGLLSIGYTVLGGIEAVVWTDVLQSIVFLGGALFALCWIPIQLGGDLGAMWETISQYDKSRLLDLRFSISEPTLWVMLVGGFIGNLIQYGTDQTVIQRYLTTQSEAEAAKSITIGAWMALPVAVFFILLGTGLFVFYHQNPTALSVNLDNADALFPWYIATQLPTGLSGLLIAAIFAATMSSLDSSMHSVATVVTTDGIKRLMKPLTDKQYLRIAQGVTAVTGLVGIVLALYMADAGIPSLWDQFNLFVGLFVGGLGGIFVLGIWVPKANGAGAIAGLFISAAVQYYISQFTGVYLLLYTATGFVSAFVSGWLISWAFPGKKKLHAGYTFNTLPPLKS